MGGITMMKILTGMLCKIIVAVGLVEHEKIDLSYVKDELLYVLIDLQVVELPGSNDVDDIETEYIGINKETFAQIILNPRALNILQKIGVDLVGLVNHASHSYER